MAVKYNYPKPFISGDLWHFSDTYLNDDDTDYNGYSGYTSVMKIKNYPSDSDSDLVLTFSGDSSIIEGNIFTYKMLPTATKIEGKEYYFEKYIYMTDEATDKITLEYGKFPVIDR